MIKVRDVKIFFTAITARENIQLLLQLAPCRKLNLVNLPLIAADCKLRRKSHFDFCTHYVIMAKEHDPSHPLLFASFPEFL